MVSEVNRGRNPNCVAGPNQRFYWKKQQMRQAGYSKGKFIQVQECQEGNEASQESYFEGKSSKGQRERIEINITGVEITR